MTHLGYLTSTLVFGALTVGIVAMVAHSREWRSYSPHITAAGRAAGSTSAVRVPVLGQVRWVSLFALAYAVLVLGFVGLTVGTLNGSIGHRVLVYSLGAIVVGFSAYGIGFSSGIPRLLGRLGYRLKRTVSFRGRPVWSLLMGWATVGAVLTVSTAVVVGLWTLSGSSILFLVAFGAGALLVVRYATSLAGVGLVPSGIGEPGSPAGRRRRSRITGLGLPRVGLQFAVGRALAVLRGWVTIAGVLVLGAAGTVGLWVAGGTVGLFGGTVVVGLVAAYAVTQTWT